MDEIKNLLQQVSIIQKKYDDLAEYSGEHYNVFEILGVTSNELSHSAILTNLLNAKGKHGQKELFLELFLNEVKKKFEESDKKKVLDNFDIKNSHAIKEKYAGRVDYDSDQGGRIDIVINDGKNNIIIENKVYAIDQPKQLVRYNEHDKKAPILYLTLEGKEPSLNSKGNLVLNQDFVCISYTDFIKDWLGNCIKEMANKPIIRETLNQYLVLVKSLTNQSTNNKMSKEIKELILKNTISSKEIYNTINSLNKEVESKLDQLIKLSEESAFRYDIDSKIKEINDKVVNFETSNKFPEGGAMFTYTINRTNGLPITTEVCVETFTIETNTYTNDIYLQDKLKNEKQLECRGYEYSEEIGEISKDLQKRLLTVLEILAKQ